jgi:PAS domain S-box-containing protein
MSVPEQGRDQLERLWRTLDTVLSNTPDFTYIFDLEGRFTYINRALLTLWQKSPEQAVGKNFFELGYPPELAGKLGRQIQQVIDTGASVRDETPYTGPTGEARYYEYIFVPIPGADGGVEAVAGSTRDITDRKGAEQGLKQQVQAAGRELERTHRELRAVAARLITAQEDERRRIARELHDDVAQRLAVLEWQLTDSRQQVRSDPVLEGLLDRLIALAAGISDEVRQLSHSLHPSILEDLGLVHALRRLCEEFQCAYGIAVHLTIAVPLSLVAPPPVAAALYRIGQEALHNSAKHGRKAAVTVELLRTPEDIRLTIGDSGPGFDQEAARAMGRGLGLLSMQERASLVSGILEVRSSVGTGTEIVVTVPLPSSQPCEGWPPGTANKHAPM